MFSFINDNFLSESMPRDGILVIDVNLQNITCLDVILDRFSKKFPVTYTKYKELTVFGPVVTGSMKLFEEDGYKIALLFTTQYRVGQSKSDKQSIEAATEKALYSLIKEAGKEAKYYSGILNRHTPTFFPMLGKLLKEYKWVIYRN